MIASIRLVLSAIIRYYADMADITQGQVETLRVAMLVAYEAILQYRIVAGVRESPILNGAIAVLRAGLETQGGQEALANIDARWQTFETTWLNVAVIGTALYREKP